VYFFVPYEQHNFELIYMKFGMQHPGLVISNIDIDVDITDDTFDVSISTILSYKSIDCGINDTLLAFFIDITSILLY